MTQDKKFKQSVRARMAETGEAYVRARNALAKQEQGLQHEGTDLTLEVSTPFNAGWYFYDTEGCVGPYASLDEAKAFAKAAEYDPEDPDSVLFIEQQKITSIVQRYAAEHLRREMMETLIKAKEPVSTAALRDAIEARLKTVLSELMAKAEHDGILAPPREDFGFDLQPLAADQSLLRGKVWIRHPERYPDLVRDLVDAGLLEHRHLLSTDLEKRSQENRRARVPQWASQDRECTVEILPSVLDSMVRMADDAHPLMTGAALYGTYSDDQEHMWVEGIAPLSSDSESGPSHFHRGTEGLAGFFADLFERTKGETYYLGEFITHPGGTAIPSPQDAATQLETVADPACQCQAPVLVVFGGIPNERDIGMFVYTRSRGQIVLTRLTSE